MVGWLSTSSALFVPKLKLIFCTEGRGRQKRVIKTNFNASPGSSRKRPRHIRPCSQTDENSMADSL